MMKRENIVHRGLAFLHHSMVNYMMNEKKMFKEAGEVLSALAQIPTSSYDHSIPSVFIALEQCDQLLPQDQRPTRPRELTVAYALEKL